MNSMSFLRSDYSIPCPTMNKNKATLIIGFCCLSIPIGMPILLLLLLRWYASSKCVKMQVTNNFAYALRSQDDDKYCNQCDIQFSSINGDPLFCDSTVPLMTSALKFTYENYQSCYWYREVIEMIRKLLMTICVVLFVGHTKIGLTCTIIVAMIFTVLHAVHKPFKSNYEGGAQFLSLILILLNLAFGAVLRLQEKQYPSVISKEHDYVYLSSFILVMNSSLFFIVFV